MQFETKLKPETVKSVTRAEVNQFLTKGKAEGNKTRSGNGALKFSSSGDTFTDQFTKAGKYKEPRKFSEIAKDAEMLWGEDPLKAVKFTLFLRTIPRVVNLPDGTKTELPQKGTELKHEAIMRMLWLHGKSPESFWNNILLFVSLGSWHDVFTMLQYDLSYNGWKDRQLDWDKFGDLILAGLNNKHTVDLVKKYLPQIKARSQATTIDAQSNNAIAKWICSLLFGNKEGPSTYKQYRKLKNSGTAHDWQKLISQSKFKDIEFDKIHGRALSILVKSKFLKNQGLSEKYAAWITAPTTKEVKYTGFVHELFEGFWTGDKNKIATIDKQFETLVEKARTNEVTDLIVVRDTSSSMRSQCPGTKSTCYDVAKALALYFSSFLKGRFADHWIEFNSTAKLQKWVGQTPTDKWKNDCSSYVGGTDFQSVVDLFCQMRSQGVPEEDFPSGILAISDGEFNKTQLDDTNVEAARKKLRNHFSKEYADNFIIVLWNLQNRYYGSGSGEKFETGVNTRGCYYFGGYSASVISFLNDGKIMTTYELMEAALNQEVLNMVEIG
jgi:hypothetical protein